MKLAIVGITALTLGTGSGLAHLAAIDLPGSQEDPFAPCVAAPSVCPSQPSQLSPWDRVSESVEGRLEQWELAVGRAFERMEWEMLARAGYPDPLR
jgi:hypothetical protein